MTPKLKTVEKKKIIDINSFMNEQVQNGINKEKEKEKENNWSSFKRTTSPNPILFNSESKIQNQTTAGFNSDHFESESDCDNEQQTHYVPVKNNSTNISIKKSLTFGPINDFNNNSTEIIKSINNSDVFEEKKDKKDNEDINHLNKILTGDAEYKKA